MEVLEHKENDLDENLDAIPCKKNSQIDENISEEQQSKEKGKWGELKIIVGEVGNHPNQSRKEAEEKIKTEEEVKKNVENINDSSSVTSPVTSPIEKEELPPPTEKEEEEVGNSDETEKSEEKKEEEEKESEPPTMNINNEDDVKSPQKNGINMKDIILVKDHQNEIIPSSSSLKEKEIENSTSSSPVIRKTKTNLRTTSTENEKKKKKKTETKTNCFSC